MAADARFGCNWRRWPADCAVHMQMQHNAAWPAATPGACMDVGTLVATIPPVQPQPLLAQVAAHFNPSEQRCCRATRARIHRWCRSRHHLARAAKAWSLSAAWT